MAHNKRKNINTALLFTYLCPFKDRTTCMHCRFVFGPVRILQVKHDGLSCTGFDSET